MRKITIYTGLIIAAAWPAFSSTMSYDRTVCPVCLEDVPYNSEMSATIVDISLDMKPIGMVTAPATIPDCLKCGFVIFKSSASGPELAQYRDIVSSVEYRGIRDRSSYYRLAFLSKKIGRNPMEVAGAYLHASWQEEQQPERFKEDLELTLEHLNASVPEGAESSLELSGIKLLRSEILRRLGRFAEAKEALRGIRAKDLPKNSPSVEILKYERVLCNRKDYARHGIGEMEAADGIFTKIKGFLRDLF